MAGDYHGREIGDVPQFTTTNFAVRTNLPREIVVRPQFPKIGLEYRPFTESKGGNRVNVDTHDCA
jgi:hypothetical protein